MRDGHAALLCVVLAGCSYDWKAGQAEGATDAAGDVSPDVVATQDALAEADAQGVDGSVADAVGDVAEASLPQCTTGQQAQVQQARGAALNCTGITPDPCDVTVNDECGCPVIVASNNAAEGMYVAAVQQLRNACIPTWCATACGPAPSPHLCLVSDAGPTMYACVQ
jgi:hypothetical protein